MPIKVTWKSILGVLTMVSGIITSAVGSGALPLSVSKVLISVGAAIVAIERIADAVDYHSDSKYNSPTGTAAPPAPPKA